MNGLEITDANAPSAKKIEVYRWVMDGSMPTRSLRMYGSSGAKKENSISSGIKSS